MRTYEESLAIWGARKAGFESADGVQVDFDFDAYFVSGGCDTCDYGARTDKEYMARITQGRKYKSVELPEDFGGVLQELFEIASEA